MSSNPFIIFEYNFAKDFLIFRLKKELISLKNKTLLILSMWIFHINTFFYKSMIFQSSLFP
jgi:hypothetical protein